MQKKPDTPLMRQYYSIKAQHPDAILLFRVGDFYEMFGEDAVTASSLLGITLTRRANGAASFVELAGFPHHALDTYLPRLVRAGQRVAVCEQLEDPKAAKKVVKRGITELVTPGVVINENVLSNKKNNFLAAVHFDRSVTGVAFIDISTGEFFVAEGTTDYADQLMAGFKPSEVLFERGRGDLFEESFGSRYYTYKLDDWIFTEDAARDRLLKQFDTLSLKGFGVESFSAGVVAAGAILYYLDITRQERQDHVRSISRIEEERFVWLDKFTVRNLEIFSSPHDGASTLIDVLDRTVSPMGARLLRRWLSLPLKEIDSLNDRLDIVGYLKESHEIREEIASLIKGIGDLERLVTRVSLQRANPREVVQLGRALKAVVPLKRICGESTVKALRDLAGVLDTCDEAEKRISAELSEDPPVMLSRGGVIAAGVSDELDELRTLHRSGKEYLAAMQEREIEKTGIPSLRIAFNNVFGYYIEVRNTHRDKVPEEWIRKQTLVNAERYITGELKEYEEKIVGAEERMAELEGRLFSDLLSGLVPYLEAIHRNCGAVARLDVLLSFAVVSGSGDYVRPTLDDSTVLDIKEGRHPVIEAGMPADEPYIPNDVMLDTVSQQIIILTGPNMSGKSALLRQTALIVLMAQCGCFVPALSARIGLVDKIFTRVGASDNLSLGESTFMVEMNEAASILNNISERSLVILDEIGRGTSTYDGISIAWAMVEYLHESSHRAKTLFATHYHELNEMERSLSRVRNYSVSIKESDNSIVFLRRLKRGGSEHSFGIHVARMAGMPLSVVRRAGEILAELEQGHNRSEIAKPIDEIASGREGMQLSLFQLDDPVLRQIRDELLDTDIDNLTPVDALNKLYNIRKLLR